MEARLIALNNATWLHFPEGLNNAGDHFPPHVRRVRFGDISRKERGLLNLLL